MKRLTIRSGFTGETYLTGEADVCWANRPIEERAFCTGCHRHKGKDRTNCGALMLIDRLAAIEDILGDEYDLDCLSPCILCRFNPPSSSDGKPCCMCPAEAALRSEQHT